MSTTCQGSTMAVSSEVATCSQRKEDVSYTHLPTQSLIVVEDIGLSHLIITLDYPASLENLTGSILSSFCVPEVGAGGWNWEMGKHGHHAHNTRRGGRLIY